MCVLIFSATFVWTISILRRTEQGMIKMYIGLHVKYPLFLSDFNESWTETWTYPYLLPPGVNQIAVNKYINYQLM